MADSGFAPLSGALTFKLPVKERVNAEQMDALLLPFLETKDEAEAHLLLAELVRTEAEPIIRGIIGRKLHVSLNGAREGRAAQEAEDIRSEILLQLLSRLGALKSDGEARAIANFRSYVAVTAHNACHEFLRQKYPERWRLKNRLRYLLTHQKGFALWESEQGEWLCGLEALRGKGSHPRRAGRIDELRNDARADERLGLPGRNLQLMNPAELVRAVLKYAGSPVELDDLVSAVASLQGVGSSARESAVDDNEETDDPYEGLADTGSDIAAELEQRRYVERLWKEICALPVRQRAALLLNLRDERGGDVIALFPMLGVASLRQIAAVLELPAEDFAALWHDLPLDDATIAERLGLTRQQVINLRKSARARLARRMKEF
jgi:RNA polymerase sigma factor (sigma-70 family)